MNKRHSVDPFDAGVKARAYGGSLDVAGLERLLPALSDQSGVVQWSAQFSRAGSLAGAATARIDVHATATVQTACVRCLAPVAQQLVVDRRYRIVPDETLAARLDEEFDDEDVLAADQRIELTDLVEDELIMALAPMPRHELCPSPDATPVGDVAELDGISVGFNDRQGGQERQAGRVEAERQYPFAGLASALGRVGQSGNGADESAGDSADSGTPGSGPVAPDRSDDSE